MRLHRAAFTALVAVFAAAVTAAPAHATAAPRLSARAAILVERSTGERLYASDPDALLPIASTTKLMTALVTLERVPLGRMFTQNDFRPAAIDSQIGIEPGERMSVHDLLLALLLPSADDAAEDLAFNVGHGSVARFVEMMNTRAHELGLAHTHYTTPSGLDTPGNYSSASDLVRLAAFLLRHQPFFARAVASPHARLQTGSHPRLVANRNDLVGRVPWVDGVKTGHTLGAGYVLVGAGAQHGMSVISAVLGTPSEGARDADTLALLRYGLSSFKLLIPLRAGRVVARPAVRDQPGVRAEVVAARTFRQVLPAGAALTVRLELPRELTGPRARGVVVGDAVVVGAGRPVARVPLVLGRALPAVSALTKAGRLLTRASTLVPLAIAFGVVVGVVVYRRQRSGRRDERSLQEA